MTEQAIGIDGAKSGWVAVLLEEGRFVDAVVAPSLAEILARYPEAGAFAIDVPIGYPERDARPADTEARKFIGARRSSVFNVPPLCVLQAPSYSEANALSREITEKGISKQSYALREKIFEAERLAADPRVYEVHPEVSFRELKGSPLEAPKKTWNGMMERLRLLEGEGISLPDHLAGGGVAADDVLDAAAAAWSARRIVRGEAEAFPDTPDDPVNPGEQARIWY